jgi:hypothetical protein
MRATSSVMRAVAAALDLAPTDVAGSVILALAPRISSGS